MFKNKQILALVDSGSVRNFIDTNLFRYLQKSKLILKVNTVNITCITASREQLQIHKEVTLMCKLEKYSWKLRFLVAKSLSQPAILGTEFLKRTQMVLDIASYTYYFKFDSTARFNLAKQSTMSSVQNIEENYKQTAHSKSNELLWAHLPKDQAKPLSQLCNNFPDVLTSKLGLTHLIEYDIKLHTNDVIKSSPFQLAPPKLEEMNKQINDLLQKNIISESKSGYSSPAFLVPKPNQKWRLVVDYRRLNKLIDTEATPLPNIDISFHWFNKARYFTVLDLNAAYHQIPLSTRSRKLTAFCTPTHLYEYSRLPFGLSTGAQVLTRLLNLVFADIKFKFVFNYMDDIVVYSETFEDHLRHLKEVFLRLRNARLTVNPDKITFAVPEISFLGHKVSYQGVAIDPDRTKSIRDFPTPTNVREVNRLAGMLNFFNKFIPHYSATMSPINLLRKKGVRFFWGQEQERALQKLKRAITNPPILKTADFHKKFILQTDASNSGLGAVLLQECDGSRQPVAYASKALNSTEKRYSTYELECLAVIFAVDKFRPYLEHAQFVLETDNAALTWLLSKAHKVGKLARWVLKLTALRFEIVHIRGTENVIADTLSRMFQVDKANDILKEQSVTDSTNVETQVNSVLTDFPLTFSTVRDHQMNDSHIVHLMDQVKTKTNDQFCVSKGVLCTKTRDNKPHKIVLPEALKPLVFKYFHHSPVGGHLGLTKTQAKITQRFYWPHMYRELSDKIKSCEICARSKPTYNTRWGQLSSRVPNHPFEALHIDLVGKLPRTRFGYQFILVCVDSFTKYTWLTPIKIATSENVIQALKQIFQNYSLPKTIVTDNGRQFTSSLFRNFCFNHGIRHTTLCPYYPAPNQSERVNRNLKASLIAYHSTQQNKWDTNLMWLQLAFNTAKHEAHKLTPFELLHAYKSQTPLDLAWRIDDLLSHNKRTNVQNWTNVRQTLIKTHQRSEHQYNKGRKPNPFRIGDLVLVKLHPISHANKQQCAKLMYKWSTPYKIVDFTSPVSVLLQDIKTRKFTKAHISQLKNFVR